MKSMALKARSRRRRESIVSLVCGTLAIIAGLGAAILLCSYLVGRPIGPPHFYVQDRVQGRESDNRGKSSRSQKSTSFPRRS